MSVMSFTPGRAAAQAAPAPAGGFALHGGLGGGVDERTGQFSVTVPLVTIDGDGHRRCLGRTRLAAGTRHGEHRPLGVGRGLEHRQLVRRCRRSQAGLPGLGRVVPRRPDRAERAEALQAPRPDLHHHDGHPARGGRAPGRSASPTRWPTTTAAPTTSTSTATSRLGPTGSGTGPTSRGGPGPTTCGSRRRSSTRYGLTTTFDYSTPNQVKVVSPERSDGVDADHDDRGELDPGCAERHRPGRAEDHVRLRLGERRPQAADHLDHRCQRGADRGDLPVADLPAPG